MRIDAQDDAVRAMVRRNLAARRQRNRRRASLFTLAGLVAVLVVARIWGWEAAGALLVMGWSTAAVLYYGVFAWRVRR